MGGPIKFENAGLFSKLTFWWVTPLLRIGMKKDLEDLDLPDLETPETSRLLCERITQAWAEQVQKAAAKGGKPSLFTAIWQTSSTLVLAMLLLLFANSIVCVCQTLVLGRMIWYFNGEENGMIDGLTWAGMLTLATLLESVLRHYFYFGSWRLGMQWRISMMNLLYTKCLKLQAGTLTQISGGHILNLATNDIERFQNAGAAFLYIFTAPCLAIAVLYIGIQYIGVAFVAGWSVLVLLIPLQMKMARQFGLTRQRTAQKTDKRIKLTNEAFSGADLMKLNGWEFPLTEIITNARKNEFKGILKGNYLRAINESVFFITPTVLSVVTFLTYMSLGNDLNAHVVFTIVALLNLLQAHLTKYMTVGIQCSSEALISIKRLEFLLNLPETKSLESEDGTYMGLMGKMTPEEPDQRKGFLFGTFSSRKQQSEQEKKPLLGSESPDYRTIEDDLEKPPVQQRADYKNRDDLGTSSSRILMRNASFQWGSDAESEGGGKGLVLKNLDLQIEDGEFVAFVGPVGAAKSSLLMAVLNEMNPPDYEHQGDVEVRGKVAYASQQPWIMTGTIRSNILFGKDYDEKKYKKVVERCSLTSDFQSLQNGDMTVVGDRGAGLSGGQRARVGLARLAYDTGAQIYLMDDPLSAVDPAVGKHLFEQVACKHLSSRTRLLVTHQVQYLQHPAVSKICVLEEGEIKAQGTFAQLVEQGHISPEFLKSKEQQAEDLKNERVAVAKDRTRSESIVTKRRGSSMSFIRSVEPSQTGVDAERKGIKGDDEDMIGEEEMNSGTVSFFVYLQYIRAMGGFLIVCLALSCLTTAQGLVLYNSAFLAYWTEKDSSVQHDPYYAHRYIILAVIALVFAVAASTSIYTLLNMASKRLHDKMLSRVVRATIGFFSLNPLGRIMNRFSKDMGNLDDFLPFIIYDLLQCTVMVIGALLFVGLAQPAIFAVLPVLMYLFLRIRAYSINSSRMLKRLEAINRSPVYSLISETLNGLTTIRAFGQQANFIETYFARVDTQSRAYYWWLAAVRWLGFYLDLLVVLLVGIATFLSVYINETYVAVDGGLLGAALTYMIMLAALFQWAVRQSAEVENQMISVERVLEFCEVDQEPDLLSDPEAKPPSEWPEKGNIKAMNLSARYDPRLPPVLSNLDFEIQGGERVGIVGRTGAGKSSFVAVLFRLLEVMEGGKLFIDERNTRELGLHDLRLKMSVIPQTPFLFSGTIRQNLDPFGSIPEEWKMWSALESVQLASVIRNLPGGLDSEVGEGGGSWSVGQRQLLCLARALLAQNRILVMDEATANIDLATDSLIQQAVRTKFEGCTVLMIAHRLETVIDCDKILVLGSGRKIEFGSPHELLEKAKNKALQNSFASMVNETGAQQSKRLRRLAKEHHDDRRKKNKR